MSENLYAAPQARATADEGVGVRSGKREDVRKVAVYQKGIIFCILFNLLAFAGQFVMPETFAMVLSVLLIVAALTSTVFVILLAMKVYTRAIGIILGILALIPLIGLVILLMVNGKANRILRDNGIHVGLLGADLSRI